MTGINTLTPVRDYDLDANKSFAKNRNADEREMIGFRFYF